MRPDVRDVPAESRYELLDHGSVVAEVGYERRPGVLVLMNTGTGVEHRGQGYAGRLVTAVVDDAARQGLRLVVRCPFARAHLSRHPQAGCTDASEH